MDTVAGCLVQVGNGIELEAVGLQFEPYRWRPCGETWDSSRAVVVIKLRRTSALAGILGNLWRLMYYINSSCAGVHFGPAPGRAANLNHTVTSITP